MATLAQRIMRETFLYYTLFFVVCGFGGWGFFQWCQPQWAFKTYWLIPAFFYLIGLITGVSLSFCEKRLPALCNHFYMLQKAVKFFLSLVLLLCVVLLGGEERKVFIGVFLVFYILTICLELWFFCRIELMKKIIQKQQAEEHDTNP